MSSSFLQTRPPFQISSTTHLYISHETTQFTSKIPSFPPSNPKLEFRGKRGVNSYPQIIRCHCSSTVEEQDDAYYMKRSLEVARRGIGHTSPNPMVGCVIVKDGKIVGEGFHPKPGQPHAEVFALRAAGDLANQATAYVTLEPCCHYGRTPPCTEALIKACVKRVVAGMVDPNPIVASKGLERLKEAGIEVTSGVEEELCKKLNEAYIHTMLTTKPFATLRYTISSNGQGLDQIGEGSADLGGYFSQLLQKYDGVIISESLLAKNPVLCSEEVDAKQPILFIIAKDLKFPSDCSVFSNSSGLRTVVFMEKDKVPYEETALLRLRQSGTDVVVLENLGMSFILDHCLKLGLCSVLVDLRGNCDLFNMVVETAIMDGLVRKVVMEVLPVSATSTGDDFITKINGKVKLNDVKSWISNKSMLVEGYLP